ncbi:MAG: hypothetical protein AUJ39_02005 [Parcubacteria group bacterium CG1_02_42_13]|uniref:Uncharacterized protein n=1 Tax=Candidatus Colwellbacteria bacterium CG23_combo_of_CG06-09_8_20_14_all_42_19 TaxID=1974541 RepID=A0A2H0ALJ7_9BACT|nr:MAG: hypothetical protein AUJ39_02005 [Parcubacteria group bacterium CG1_02_42_13]PIP46289.1 MAG: hypothetical protein COX15_01075 [Candidatus Colwellbacteria bacterium CG23_combo_of_CG06-09_8_20_14_all_42_19]
MDIKIKIEGGGLSFEGETDIVKAAQVIAFIKSDSIPNPTKPAALLTGVTNTQTTPRQALVDSNAKTNPEKITVLGKYLMDRDNQTNFSGREVQEIMKKTGEKMPKNFSRDLQVAIDDLGYIFEDDVQKGQYSVTDGGAQAILNGFSLNNQNRNSRRKSKTNKSGGKKAIREEVNKLDISGEKEGLPNYWQIDSKGHRILWLINYAESNKIDGLSPVEIESLATKLRDDIESKNVRALTTKSAKNNFIKVDPSGKYKILQNGIKFLKKSDFEKDAKKQS